MQEAFLRLHRALERRRADRVAARLPVAVVTRLCIDQLRSARARRETLRRRVAAGAAARRDDDPARHAEMADSLSLAFLVLLESLSPEQRAAFLLREVFDYPYDEIAEIVGKSEDNARQLAARARRHVEERPAALRGVARAPRAARRPLLRRRSGTATSRRSRSCWPRTSSCTATAAARRRRWPARSTGATRRAHARAPGCARAALGGSRSRRVEVNGQPGAITFDADGRVVNVMALDIADGPGPGDALGGEPRQAAPPRRGGRPERPAPREGVGAAANGEDPRHAAGPHPRRDPRRRRRRAPGAAHPPARQARRAVRRHAPADRLPALQLPATPRSRTCGSSQQFNPISLSDHLANGRPWDLDRTTGGLLMLPPRQGHDDREGFQQGTADALWRNAPLIREFAPEALVVVSADAVYSSDYGALVEEHLGSGADVTMVTTEVDPGRRRPLRRRAGRRRRRGRATTPTSPTSRRATSSPTRCSSSRPAPLWNGSRSWPTRRARTAWRTSATRCCRASSTPAARASTLDGYWRDVGTVRRLLGGAPGPAAATSRRSTSTTRPGRSSPRRPRNALGQRAPRRRDRRQPARPGRDRRRHGRALGDRARGGRRARRGRARVGAAPRRGGARGRGRRARGPGRPRRGRARARGSARRAARSRSSGWAPRSPPSRRAAASPTMTKWGIAGLGRIAALVAGDFPHVPSADLVAVGSRAPARAAGLRPRTRRAARPRRLRGADRRPRRRRPLRRDAAPAAPRDRAGGAPRPARRCWSRRRSRRRWPVRAEIVEPGAGDRRLRHGGDVDPLSAGDRRAARADRRRRDRRGALGAGATSA